MSASRFSHITLKKQLIFLIIFAALPAFAQEVQGNVIFHTPDENKQPVLETPFRKPAVVPPEKPNIPKVNSPEVPGSDPIPGTEKPEEPNRRPPASQRRPVLPPPGLEDILKTDKPKEVPEGRKPLSLIDSSPVVFSQGDIAIYPWMEKEEYFDYESDKVIPLKAHILRSEEVVLPDNLSRVKFMDGNGALTIFPRDQIANIPLDHMYYSQDILFLDDEGVIRQMVYRTETRSPKPVVSKEEVRSVLQLNAGSIHKLGLKIGDKVAIPPRL